MPCIWPCFSLNIYFHLTITGQKRIAFADFLPILAAVKADNSATGCKEDYVEGLKVSSILRCVRQERISIRGSVGPSVGPSVTPVRKPRFLAVFSHGDILH